MARLDEHVKRTEQSPTMTSVGVDAKDGNDPRPPRGASQTVLYEILGPDGIKRKRIAESVILRAARASGRKA